MCIRDQLTLPFTVRFEQLTGTHRDAYFAAFLCTAVSTVLLMAPSANHRLRFREHDKERMLFWFNRLALAGSAFLAAAIAPVSYTHLRAHETRHDLVCRLLLEKKKKKKNK